MSAFKTAIGTITSVGGTVTIVDASNYDTNTDNGHNLSSTGFVRAFEFVNEDTSEVFSSNLSIGNVEYLGPATNPVPNDSCSAAKDGICTLNLFAIPVWFYVGTGPSFSINDIVFTLDGNFYKSTVNSNTSIPGSDSTWTKIVTSADKFDTIFPLLTAKYKATLNNYINTGLIQKSYLDSIINAENELGQISPFDYDYWRNNRAFLTVGHLKEGLAALPLLTSNLDISQLINSLTAITLWQQ